MVRSALTPILAAADADQMIKMGLATAADEHGNRLLHKVHSQPGAKWDGYARKDRPYVENYPQSFATIPDQMFSEATIYYFGFTAEKTAEIWADFVHRCRLIKKVKPAIPLAFIRTCVSVSLDRKIDVDSDKDDATLRRVMTLWGVSNTVQDVILDPAHRHLRTNKSCSQMVMDVVDTRYNMLCTIRKKSHSRARFCPWLTSRDTAGSTSQQD